MLEIGEGKEPVVEFTQENKRVIERSLKEIEAHGDKAKHESHKLLKEVGDFVYNDIGPVSPSKNAVKAAFEIISLLPGANMGSDYLETAQERRVGSESRIFMDLYFPAEPGKGSPHSFIEAGIIINRNTNSFEVELAKVVDLNELRIRFRFERDSKSLLGGRIISSSVNQENISFRSPKGEIEIDSDGVVRKSDGALDGVSGKIDTDYLTRDIMNVETANEGIELEKYIS